MLGLFVREHTSKSLGDFYGGIEELLSQIRPPRENLSKRYTGRVTTDTPRGITNIERAPVDAFSIVIP